MSVRDHVVNNLGYALLGGPAVALFCFGIGVLVSDLLAGAVLAVAAYVLGWVLTAHRSRRGDAADRDSATEKRSRREGELEAEKAGYGGNGGAG